MEQIYKNHIYENLPSDVVFSSSKTLNSKSILEKFFQQDEDICTEKLAQAIQFSKQPIKNFATIFGGKDNKEVENQIQQKIFNKQYYNDGVKHLNEVDDLMKNCSSTYVEQEIESANNANMSSFSSIEKSDESNVYIDEKIDENKDEEYDEVSQQVSYEKVIENEDNTIDRLLKMVSIDDVQSNPNNQNALLRSPFDFNSYSSQLEFECFQKSNYCIYFILITAYVLLTLLRTTSKIFGFMKVWFDKIILFSWNNLQNMRGTSDFNLLVLLAISPFFILLIVTYIGFCLIYLVNKILLLKIPNSFVKQFNFPM